MTISDNWAYRWNEHNYKSTETLLHNLVDIASKGGNYLLNVGPDADGVIPQPEVDRLQQIGVWMKANGDSIYGTTRSPLISLPDYERMTVKGDTYYLHVFSWTAGAATLPGLDSPVESATTLIGNQKLTVAKDFDEVTTVSVPSHTDPIDTVVVLKLAGPLKVSDVPFKANPDGSFTLSAQSAKLSDGLVLQNSPPNIGYWTKPNLKATWYIQAPSGGGSYTVELVYACAAGSAGSTFDLSSPTSKVSGSVAETGVSWNTYTSMTLPGELHLASGAQILTIAATSMPHGAVMNLRSITLIPAK